MRRVAPGTVWRMRGRVASRTQWRRIRDSGTWNPWRKSGRACTCNPVKGLAEWHPVSKRWRVTEGLRKGPLRRSGSIIIGFWVDYCDILLMKRVTYLKRKSTSERSHEIHSTFLMGMLILKIKRIAAYLDCTSTSCCVTLLIRSQLNYDHIHNSLMLIIQTRYQTTKKKNIDRFIGIIHDKYYIRIPLVSPHNQTKNELQY